MSKRDALAELATQAGLRATADLLARFERPAAFEGLDLDEHEPPSAELIPLLQQCARRGLDPLLVPTLLEQFAGRPLEQGLIAWDVLSQSVWPADETMIFARLQALIAEVASVRPPSAGQLGLDLQARSAVDVLRAMAPRAGRDLLEGLKELDLGCIAAALASVGPEGKIARHPKVGSALVSMGRLIGLAHLPTLSSLYLDLAARGIGYRPAALALCDLMFDVGAGQRLPVDAIRAGDVDESEFVDVLESVICRAKIDAGHRAEAIALAKANLASRGERPLSPRLAVVFADLFHSLGLPGPPDALLDAACEANQLWCYAWRVRAAHAAVVQGAASESLRPLELCSEFTARFGNNWRCWHDAFLGAPGPALWKIGACAIVAREVQMHPHDAHAWQTLLVLIAPDDVTLSTCVDELNQRLVGQVAPTN